MKRYLEFVDEILYEFQGHLRFEDICKMTYKEIGYMREHRRKHHPPEADSIARALLGGAGGRRRGAAPPQQRQGTPKRQAPRPGGRIRQR